MLHRSSIIHLPCRTPNPGTLLILAGLCASPAWAQSEPTDPAPGNAQQVEDARSVLPRVGTNETAIEPTLPKRSDPQQPGLTQGQDWLQILHDTLETEVGAATLAEGAFVLGRLGDLIETPSGLIIFVPDRETREPGEGAVLVMPSQTLEQLQGEWTNQRVLISGEIFTYHDRNQILISDYRLVRPEPTQAAPTEPESTDTQPDQDPQAAPTSDQPIEADPEVRDLLDELDRTQPRSRVNENDPLTPGIEILPRTQVQRSTQTNTGPEEGTLLLRRPARMVRNAQGAWSLVFDNDQPRDPSAQALVVLPCRALMRMEQWAMDQGDAVRFLVSGRVYTYKGQSYLLPTLAQRMGPSELNSIQ